MDGGSDGGGRCGGGGREELIEAVLTCEGHICDPELPKKLTCLVHALKHVTHSDSTWFVRKVEPWNSVRVTFSIPREAAIRLHQLAQAGDQALRQLGILSVQVEGDQVISLKVAGPNNESTEIVLRTDGGASDSAGTSSVARSVTTALGGAGLMPTHAPEMAATSAFRSPGILAPPPEGLAMAPRPMAPVKTPYSFGSMNRVQTIRELQHQQPPIQPMMGHVAAAVAAAAPPLRPVYNPPPPYPNLDPSHQSPLRAPGVMTAGQRPPPPMPPQLNGTQYVPGPAGGAAPVAQPSTQVLPSVVQVSSNQPVSGSYPVPVTQTVNNRAVHGPGVKGSQRTGGSGINSPLLVDLLRQPDHQPRAKPVLACSPHGSPAPASPSSRSTTSTPSSDSLPHTPLANLPLPAVPAISPPPASSSTAYSAVVTAAAGLAGAPLPAPYSAGFGGRTKDVVQTHQQVYSGGSVITSTVAPHPRLPNIVSGGLQQHPQATGQPPPGPRLPYVADQRSIPVAAGPSTAHPKVPMQHPARPTTHAGEPRVAAAMAVAASSPQHSSGGKESQYLINPNTGLLEPRPSESSDSEPEARPPSPANEETHSNSVVSDDESNTSAASKKETDQSDSDASRISLLSVDSKKVAAASTTDRPKVHERDSSPIGASWENSVVSSGTTAGESIKLKLTIGRESVAQTTFSRPRKGERKEAMANSCLGSQGSVEPRVPKLHIKLKSKQAVIVNPLGDGDSPRGQEKEAVKEDKNKRRSCRNKSRSSESDSDSGKVRGLKIKSSKEKGSGEESATILKLLDGKKVKVDVEEEETSLKMKFKEGAENRLKPTKSLEDGRLPLGKSEGTKLPKGESKFRTRVKTKTPIRKVGDLNSVGEIASHKILDTLPPSITRVAALHTQQPHVNPSSSSSSTSSSSSSGQPSAVVAPAMPTISAVSTTHGIGDIKTDLEKRGSEVASRKTEGKVEVEKGSDSLSRLHPVNNLTSLMNGDLTHGEKLILGCILQNSQQQATGGVQQLPLQAAQQPQPQPQQPQQQPQQQQQDGPSSGKLTIKKKGSGETHTLESLKNDLPEGIGSIPKYLNSSVMINKVSHSPEKLPSSRHEDPAEKNIKKLDLTKHTICTDLASLKANSDITIHSVTKKETLSFSKASDGDRGIVPKAKSEVTKVGKVTHLDVNDRKALQDALKFSQSSTRKNDTHSSSVHDLLRRFNAIDSSTTVPVSSQSESTNSTSGVKVEPKVTETPDKVKNEVKSDDRSESKEPHISSVNSSNSCDTSVKVEPEQTKILEQAKAPEFPGNVILTKGEVESPDGTPKGEHGSGQGGEDSGIESMDALSEKSPNQSDQSPTRRDDKECEPFPEKSSSDKTVSKRETGSGGAGSGSGGSVGGSREAQNLARSVSEEPETSAQVQIKVEPLEHEEADSQSGAPSCEVKSTKCGGGDGSMKTCESVVSIERKPVIVKEEEDEKQSLPSPKAERKQSEPGGDSASPAKAPTIPRADENKAKCTSQDTPPKSEECDTTATTTASSSTFSSPLVSSSSLSLPSVYSSLPVTPSSPVTTELLTIVSSASSSSSALPSSSPTSSCTPTSSPVISTSSSVTSISPPVTTTTTTPVISSTTSPITASPVTSTISSRIIPTSSPNSVTLSQSSSSSSTHSSTTSSITTIVSQSSPSVSISSVSLSCPTSPSLSPPTTLSTYSVTPPPTSVSPAPQSSAIASILGITTSTSTISTLSLPVSSALPCSSAPSSHNFCAPDTQSLTLACSTNSSSTLTHVTTTSPSITLTTTTITTTTTTSHTPVVSSISVIPTVPHSPKMTAPTTATGALMLSKPSLLAFTLTRPLTSSAPSQVSSSIQATSLPAMDKLPILSSPPELGCGSSSMSTSSTGTTAPIITAGTTATVASSATGAKVVTLKPSTSQGQVSTSLNLPPGTTFRLVALPGNSAMAPTTSAVKVVVSPVKGQLSQQVTSGIGSMTVVTVKPVVMATGGAKNSHLLQTLTVNKTEESSPPSLLKAQLTAPSLTTSPQAVATSVTNSAATPIVSSTLTNGDDTEDLDFVGFSSTPQVKLLQPGELQREIARPDTIETRLLDSCKSPEVLSPTGEEPTPLRVHPPLYTYGNRERKKDVESDAEDKDREEAKMISECEGTSDLKGSDLLGLDKEKECVASAKPKAKDKKFDALSIEIPPSDPTLADDKRLTRSTRQSARLASPKVNSPGADLSPKVDRRSPASMLSMGKPSPVSVLRPSMSPATRGTKRRRHESESSNASSINDDTQEPATKVTRRKPPDKAGDDYESSEDDSLDGGGGISKKRNPSAASTSTNEDEDDSRPSSRSSRTSCKAARSRERQSSAESTGTTRDTTPTRRTPRQNNRAATKERSPEPGRERGLAGLAAAKAAAAGRDSRDKGTAAAAAAATKDPMKEKEVTKEKEVDRKEPVKDKDAQLKDKRTPAVVLKETKVILKEKSPQSKDKDKSPVQGTKTRKDSEQSESDASNRRKTRSTATTNEDTPNKRRRMSKEK